VIGIPGECAMRDTFTQLIHDIAILNTLGIRLVICHGARPQIEQAILQQGGQNNYAKGIRVTDANSLNTVKQIISVMHLDIQAMLSMAGNDIRISSGNFVTAQPIGVLDGVDYQYTGRVRNIDATSIVWQLERGAIVLISPLGHSPSGETFSLAADELTAKLARALHADKAVFLLSDSDVSTFSQHARALTLLESKNHLKNKLPDSVRRCLQIALDCCSQGVNRVHFLDYALDGAILLELFTRDGCGLMISADNYDDMRAASIDDIGGILELIEPLEDSGVLVRRSRQKLEMEISQFFIMERDKMIIGCAALYTYDKEGLAELACLAIHPNYQGEGRGQAILDAMEKIAVKMGIKQLFVLTTQTTHWFLERNFKQCDMDVLPIKHQALYNYKRNSKVLLKKI
jgi:amino-acid N-acetyltransferase